MWPAAVAKCAAGNGYKTIEMNFLPDVLVPCEACQGKRYNRETLDVRFKGKSIADVLDMTINQAVEFFAGIPAILSKVKTTARRRSRLCKAGPTLDDPFRWREPAG